MKKYFPQLIIVACVCFTGCSSSKSNKTTGNKNEIVVEGTKPAWKEIINPLRKASFNNNDSCKELMQGGGASMVNGYQVFPGSTSGDRQVDPQIAVGGGFVLHGTNTGLYIYNKKGDYISGVSQNCFQGGIDPKLFFDVQNQVFGFDLWKYWDKEKIKPVNISISETADPRGARNTYAVPSPKEGDGGGIACSKKWIGYSFDNKETFVLKMADAKAGKSTTVYHFSFCAGNPVMVQYNIDDLYFLNIDNTNITINRITENKDGTPVCIEVSKTPHHLQYVSQPPASPQKETSQRTASGDRNPKNVVMQNGYLWFSQTINYKGRAAVQWHQLKTSGEIVQTGLISDPNSSYIQTTMAVNKNNDVIIGFQETNDRMYISPRFAYRMASDTLGKVRGIISLGEGKGFTDGQSWGDYSGSVIDGDNLTDLWTIQSITSEKGKGHVVIAEVPFK